MTTSKTKYNVVDGTYYNSDTPREVIRILEHSRNSGMRIRVHYGDTETGQDWGDVYDVTGRVGRSMGLICVPLMISNARSMGGTAMLDDCIVRIRHANRKEGGDLYRHPSYSPPPREDHPNDWEKHFA